MFQKKVNWTLLMLICFCISVTAACATAPKPFDPSSDKPQIIVDPPEISLGIAAVMDTVITFSGRNFAPEDEVVVKIMAVSRDGEKVDIPIANASTDAQGSFIAELNEMSKVVDILRADVELNEEMDTILIVTRPPIPVGEYEIKAESMRADKTARTHITLKKPSLGDKIKDWIGRVLLKKIKKG